MAGFTPFLSALALLFGSATGMRKVVKSDKGVACTDKSAGCLIWAAQGLCEQLPFYMAENCCGSCSSVPAPAPPLAATQHVKSDRRRANEPCPAAWYTQTAACFTGGPFLCWLRWRNENCCRSCTRIPAPAPGWSEPDDSMATQLVKSDRVSCSDKNASCASWTGQGYCSQSSQYFAYMAENCCGSCSSGPAPGTCGFVTQPVEVPNSVGAGYRSFIYTEPYRADLWVDGLLLRDSAFQQYTQWLTATMARNFGDVDPFNQTALLIRQRDVYAQHGMASGEWDVMLSGRAGAITAANCIESALWAKQNEHHPLSVDESEFGAYILVDGANTTVKVYLQTGPSASVPHMSWATQPITQDLSSGFRMLTFLHLHPFFADQPRGVDCAGTCVPSSPDLRAFASGLMRSAQSFWITNGHDSFRFPSSELGMFTPAAAAAGALGAKSVQRERPEGPLDLSLGAKNLDYMDSWN